MWMTRRAIIHLEKWQTSKLKSLQEYIDSISRRSNTRKIWREANTFSWHCYVWMKVFSFLGPKSVVLCVNADTATQKTNNVRPLGTGCENTQTVVSVDPLLPQMCLELCEIISEEEVARRTQTQRYVGTCLSNSEGQKWDGGEVLLASGWCCLLHSTSGLVLSPPFLM